MAGLATLRVRFWTRWSTRTRLLLITVLPVTAMCLTLVWYSYQSRQNEVRAELAERGLLLARVLADGSEVGLSTGRYAELRQTLEGVAQSDASIYRVALFDAAHKELLRVDGRAGSQPETRLYEAAVLKRLIWVSMPDLRAAPPAPPGRSVETIGYVRVTMSPTRLLARQENRFYLELLVAVAGLLACGLLAARMVQGFDDSLQASLRALREADAEKRRLIRRVNGAVEEERKTIALEIHDELNATLIAVRLEAQGIAGLARQESAAAEAEAQAVSPRLALIESKAQSITKLALRLYNSGRTLVRRLRPEMLDMLGLQGAAEEMVRHYDETHPSCRFSFAAEGDFSKLDGAMAISAYRIIQEALSNIVKHAQASHATVALALREGSLHIEVRDNGRGFDPAQQAEGIGIVGMRERVAAFEGCFDLHSGGEGSVVEASLPLKGDAALSSPGNAGG
ncbi:ATP-binding protein [Massilia sp. BJB1822]|uniref:ATP-binding protein n=1 Tax=Massilia sp. BJB1822 TaxID=2744470 RepID=UPI001594E4DA|nr:ATP-binding protein [Massilia sp. BJB1822]NVD98542.1 ATP-binding protein [Massilia sp. BJB1822]